MEHQATDNKSELSKMKQEIIKEVRPDKKQKTISWGSRAVTVVLAVLFLVSIAQTVQSASILSKIKSGAVKSATAGSPSAGTLPSSLNNLPDMVGGC